MTAISRQGDDIWTVGVPGAKEGDIVEILDADDVGRRVRLGLPMGDQFAFTWADPAEPQAGGRFVKQNDEWLIQTDAPHRPGDRVLLSTQKGLQEHTLGESAGENLFRPQRHNHFVKNPVGTEPKWCVRVYDARRAGDTVDVAKKDGSSQKHVLVAEVQDGIWTTKKA